MYPKWFNETLVKKCKFCKKSLYPKEWKSSLRIYRESKVRFNKRMFCGDNCRAKYVSKLPPESNYFYGKHLTPWNKGKKGITHARDYRGYERIYYPDGGFTYLHRLITNCPKGMVVHHKDGDKTNNELNNLQIMTNSEHAKLHHLKKNGN